MLEWLDSGEIPLEELEQKLEDARDIAEENGHMDIWPILRRAYWKKKNRDQANSATPR